MVGNDAVGSFDRLGLEEVNDLINKTKIKKYARHTKNKLDLIRGLARVSA
jgi:hypothetical protein